MTDEQKQPAVVVSVSAAQVWSAALQNIIFGLCITAGWLLGKVSSEFAVVALCLLAGIDLAGRRKLPGSGATALAIGATGVLHKFPGISTILGLSALAASAHALISVLG